MITIHKYLDQYPVLPDSKKLIVGTIHPHNHNTFEIPFFYGNVKSIWTILSDAFPKELKQPITLERILAFLKNRRISISDTILECERQTESALDKDLIPTKLNFKLKDDIRNSRIKEIFFTSGFQKNNAFRLFYVDILGMKITKEIRKNREVILDKQHFGRPVKLTILYSPSGSSNIGLSRSEMYLKNREKYANSQRPVYDFKVEYYRKKLDKK